MMQLRFLVLLQLILSSALSAQTSELGELLIIRETGKLKSAEVCTISIEDSLVGSLSNNSCKIIKLTPGTYNLKSSIGKRGNSSESLTVNIEAGMLVVLQCELFQRSKKNIIPSQGFYFVLKKVHPQLVSKVLQQKTIKELLQEYLYKELLDKHDLR